MLDNDSSPKMSLTLPWLIAQYRKYGQPKTDAENPVLLRMLFEIPDFIKYLENILGKDTKTAK